MGIPIAAESWASDTVMHTNSFAVVWPTQWFESAAE